RHRTWPSNLPRICGSDGRRDQGGQSSRQAWRSVHDNLAIAVAAGPKSGMMQLSPIRILVVDDEPPIRRFLRTSLSAERYDVIEAEDGEAALSSFRRNAVDLIVLDLGLPGMDGFEIIRQIRELRSTVPIVILSARDDEAG